MKNLTFLSVIVGGILFSACSDGGKELITSLDNCPLVATFEQVGPNKVMVAHLEQMGDTLDMSLSSLVEDLYVIPLDNRDEALTKGENPHVTENYILIRPWSGEAAKLFDKEGRFICKIGDFGQGPGEYQNLYDEYVADIAVRTVNGSNDNRLQEEEYFVRKQLDAFLLPAVPEVKPGKFSYGWYIGTGALIPTGDIADAFGYAWLFNIGLTAGYDRLFLKADISYGQPRLDDVRKELFGRENEWAVNRYANQLSGVVALGYRVLDTKHFAITVNVGGGWTNYAWDVADFVLNTDNPDNNPEIEYVRNSEIRRNTIHNFNYMAGLDFDWNFHTAVSDKPFFLSGRREQYTSSLRLSPYFMHQKYSKLSPQRSGYQIGIMLSYSGLARALGFK